MKPTFWLEKWQANEIGFHNPEIHPLIHTWSRLELAKDTRVLVPLCGKSKDMLWLANQGHHVVGVEISEIAAESFFAENDLTANTSQIGNLTRYRSEHIEIWVGDFLSLESAELGSFDAIYDRASLIALAPDTRASYVRQCSALCASEHKILLIGLEYLPDAIVPPPFSLSRSEIETIYGPGYVLDHLETVGSDAKGIPARENAYRLVSKSPEIDVS